MNEMKNVCMAVWVGAMLGCVAYGQADMSVLEGEIAQAAQMTASIDAYLATGSDSFKKPLRVVYFCPGDVEPFDDYQARVGRIMRDLQQFFGEEMARNGFPDQSLNLEMIDGQLKIHLVRSLKGTAEYDYNSGNAIKQETSAELQRRGIRMDQEHVLIICALAEVTKPYSVRLYAPFYGLGANQAHGLCFVADCPWMDTLHFSNTDIKVHVGEHGRSQSMTLGRFNTTYIGGTVHELGHGMSLPHNKERGFEKAALGTALMGSGNYTYKQELRGRDKGTFLTFASATRLATLGIFNDRVKGLDQIPACELSELSFGHADDAITLAGRIETDVPAYAVVAYNDPDGSSDYDAVPWTCAVKPDGTYSVAVRDLLPGSLVLRLTVCHVNGATSVFSYPYTCSEDGVPDIDRLGLPWILQEAVALYAEGNRPAAESKAKKLLAAHRENELTSRYLSHLIELCSDTGPYERPGALSKRQKSAMLSDCQWESAQVGWMRPVRNEYGRERKGDSRIFLEIGDAFHAKGLYAHSPSKYVFDLGGAWKTLRTSYGLQRGGSGKVVFVVVADGKEVFRSECIEGSKERSVELDVRSVERLELVVENGGDGNGQCWSVWGSPEVLR